MAFYDTLKNNKFVVERYNTTKRGYSSTTIYKGDNEEQALAKFNAVREDKMVDVTLYVNGNKKDVRVGLQK